MTPEKLRIAAELHCAPGWVPVVPDSSLHAAYQINVIMWFPPKPFSHEFARRVVEAFNAASSARTTEVLKMAEYTTSVTARAVFDILNPVASAVENLACHQEQCDQDGAMVKVSRQALDEVLEAINKLAIAAAQDVLLGEAGQAGARS